MREFDKKRLVEQLLALFAARQRDATPRADQPDLRLQIEQAVDAAMFDAREAGSRCVTMLLSDLRGFTAVAERHTPQEMIEALNRYFERMSGIIYRYGGTIDKFMGDAIMALFGAPMAPEDCIVAALACAIEMQIAMDDINRQNRAYDIPPLYMGIGINTGEVVVGKVGSSLYSEYTVVGDEVNLASRIAAHSLRGQVLLSENTYRRARHFIETGEINEVKVKGKKGSVRMYELLVTSRPIELAVPQRKVRKGPRVEVDMPLTFQLVRGKSVLAQKYLGRISDISYGGMRIVSQMRLDPFSEIKIALSLFAMASELSEIYGKVLHVGSADEGYACRVEFTSIDARATQTIKQFVDGIVELNRN